MTTKQRSALRKLANTLKPAVTVGKGELTDNVIKEIETALYNYELVKVAALKSCTVSSAKLMETVCEALSCEPVQSVGNRFVVYKLSDKDGIVHVDF